MDYLSFRHQQQHFALPIDCVRFIAAENALTPTNVATGNSQTFDMVDYEGQACVILSLARLLNQPSERTKNRNLIQLLQEREQDHLNWLNALRESLQKNTPFDKQRDPDLCAFGSWYKSYKADDPQLAHLLSRFDEPHRRLHALAGELLALRDEEQQEKALHILHEHEHSTLARLLALFHEARDLVANKTRPTVIMVQVKEGQIIGLKVDDVGEVFSCGHGQEDTMTDYLPHFGRRWLKGITIAGSEVTIMEINPARLLSSASAPIAEALETP